MTLPSMGGATEPDNGLTRLSCVAMTVGFSNAASPLWPRGSKINPGHTASKLQRFSHRSG